MEASFHKTNVTALAGLHASHTTDRHRDGTVRASTAPSREQDSTEHQDAEPVLLEGFLRGSRGTRGDLTGRYPDGVGDETWTDYELRA